MGLVHVMEFPSNAERDYLNLSICSMHAKFLAGVHDQRGRDLAESVTELKQDPELNLLMHGYGPVAKTLLRRRLLDELILWVHPMLAGVGTTQDMIFTEELNTRLALLSYGPS